MPVKSYSSREVIARLEQDGWVEVRVRGDHYHFRHPTRLGTVTVRHPVKDIGIKNLKSIEKQSGLVF